MLSLTALVGLLLMEITVSKYTFQSVCHLLSCCNFTANLALCPKGEFQSWLLPPCQCCLNNQSLINSKKQLTDRLVPLPQHNVQKTARMKFFWFLPAYHHRSENLGRLMLNSTLKCTENFWRAFPEHLQQYHKFLIMYFVREAMALWDRKQQM